MTKTTIRKPYLVAIIAGVLLATTALATSSTNFAKADPDTNDVVVLTCIYSFGPNNHSFLRQITASPNAVDDIAGIPVTLTDALQIADLASGPPFFSNCAEALSDLLNSGFAIVDSEGVTITFGQDTDDSGSVDVIGTTLENIYTLVRESG